MPIIRHGTENLDSDNPEYYEPGLPVVSFRLSDEFVKENPKVQQRWIQVIYSPLELDE